MDDTSDTMDHWCHFQSLTHGPMQQWSANDSGGCTSTPPWFTQQCRSLGRMISLHSQSAPFCMQWLHWKHNYELMSFLLMTLSPIGMYFRAMESDTTEKSDSMIKSCNIAGLPGKSCQAARLLLTGLYPASCCCTGLWSVGFWRSSGTGLYHVIINDYLICGV